MQWLRTLLGDFRWTPPKWLQRLGGRRLLLVLGSIILVAMAAVSLKHYLDSLPQPSRVHATAIAPPISPVVEDQLRPQPLRIEFEVVADPRVPSDTVESVARLDLLGETLESGINMQPAMPGEWRWVAGRTLLFEPAQDWPAGQTYTVRYDEALFAPGLEFASLDAEFTTPAFTASLDELVFYQDPVDKNERRLVATLSFTHPVDSASLRQKLSLNMRPSGANVNESPKELEKQITFDATARTAYINSATVAIPDNENYATLQIDAGLKAVAGPARLQKEIVGSVRIPDVGSYFKTSAASAIIATGDDDRPQQSLVLEFTDHVRTTELSSRMKIWVLPKNLNINGGRVTNKYWSSPREVTNEVLNQSRSLPFELNPTEHIASLYHSATLDIPEGSWIYVRVEEGLESEGGFVMSRMYDNVLLMPDYPRQVSVAQSGALLPLTRDHKLTFVSRGVNALRVDISRLQDDQLNHLASQTRGDISSPQFTNYNFNEDNMSLQESRQIDLQVKHPADATYSSLDLSEFLPQGGYYLINVRGWNRDTGFPDGGGDRRLVLVTDLGLLVKSNADSSQDVFVHSIASGKPVAGATVSLLGKNGVALFERTSDADGHVSFPVTREFERSQAPTVFVVKNGGDSVFMPYGRGERRLQYSRFDIGGEYDWDNDAASKLKAQVFSDRGIYRPGDTVNLGLIVKGDDWQPLGDLPLRLQINEPRGQVVKDEYVRLPAGGFFDQSLQTETSSPTGSYNATLFLIDRDDRRRVIGSTSFRVEEFQPDRLRIRSSISGAGLRGWVGPEELAVDVSLQNLFGTPAQSRRVTGQAELRPSSIYFSELRDFRFTDPLRDNNSAMQAITIPLLETTTDNDGNARLDLPTAQYERGIFSLTVMTEGFEEGGGRSVKSRAQVMMSPLSYLVGYKTETDLSFIDKASSHAIEFVAVNSDGDEIELDKLTMTLLEQRYVSTLIRRPNGTYAYQSILKENEVSSEPFVIDAGHSEYALPTDRSGSFALKLMDADGLVLSNVEYTVAGARNAAGNLERNAELDLSLKEASYRAGDAIQMQITAPYTGTGLITIERDKVLAYKWFRTDTTTTMQSIRVPEGIEGNAYVNVAFVRDIDSPEIYVSPLSYAVQPFAIDRSARTIDIKLDAPALARPGERLQVSYSASQDSKLVVYAVDEGILQVARYQMPKPLEYFVPKKALQVATFQMVDLILPEFEAYLRAAAPGGGEGALLAGRNLNPFQRKTEPPLVFWSGIVAAGAQTASVNIEIPDYYNGELRVMAVAVSDTAVGRAQQTTTVRGAFVITPNLLTAAAPGDEFDVTVGISNNMEDSSVDALSLSASASSHLEIISGAEQKLTIAPGDEGRASLRVRARQQLGGASLSFSVSAGGEQARRSATVSVRPSVPYRASMLAGSTSSLPAAVELPRTLYPEFAQQSAAASSSPLILADGMLDYLEAFPHACAEQMVSKVFPQMGFLGSPDSSVDQAAIRAQLGATIEKLRARQMPEGGFRFWISSREPHAFASVYITHFLSDAREQGQSVPPAMLTAALGYLQQIAGQQTTTIPDARLRAHAIYVLTRNGHVTTNYLTNLHEQLQRNYPDSWREDIAASWMAASYILLKQQELGAELIRHYEMGAGNEMERDFDTRLGRDAQHVYLVAKHFPHLLENIDGEQIEALVRPIMSNRFNTLSASYTILALQSWTAAVSSDTAELGIYSGQGERLAEATQFVRAALDSEIRSVEFRGDLDSELFHVVSQTGFDRADAAAAIANGIEVQRDYLNDAGIVVTSATIGDELTVRLRVRSMGQARSNIAVVDLLPGGFEVLSESVPRSWSADHIDVREDRVIIYANFSSQVSEYRYRAKVTSAGSFVVPSATAASMYDRAIESRSAAGRFEVSRAQ